MVPPPNEFPHLEPHLLICTNYASLLIATANQTDTQQLMVSNHQWPKPSELASNQPSSGIADEPAEGRPQASPATQTTEAGWMEV
jgi:hypothetical protein